MNPTILNITTVLQVNSTLVEQQVRESMISTFGGTLAILSLLFTVILVAEGLRISGKIQQVTFDYILRICVFAGLFVGWARVGFLLLGI